METREWRNRQTRTFEGRVVIPYGFKSRLSHQLWKLRKLLYTAVYGLFFYAVFGHGAYLGTYEASEQNPVVSDTFIVIFYIFQGLWTPLNSVKSQEA